MSTNGPRGVKKVWLALVCFLWSGCDGSDRAKEMESAAGSLGLSFSAELPPKLGSVFREMPSMGHRRQNFFTRALVSEDVAVFDWTWRKGPAKERNREQQTVIAIKLSQESVPAFAWSEQGAFSSQDLRALGGGVPFEGAASFSDRFEVAGPDREGIRTLFDEARRGGLDLPRGMRVEGNGEWLIGYRLSTLVQPDDLSGAIDEVREVARSLTLR